MTKLFFFFLIFNISKLIGSDTEDEIIKLNVGGKVFETYRSTLTFYPDSFLGVMFSKDSKFEALKKDENGYIFLDDDPVYFEHILYFLRYNRINVINTDMAKQLKVVAEKFCLTEMCEEIDKLTFKFSLEHCSLKIIQISDEQPPNWYLARNDDFLIGSDGFHHKIAAQKCLVEFLERNINKELCFASGPYRGARGIFNINNNKLIGEYFVEIPELNPIKEAIKIDDNNYYICSRKSEHRYAIFNAITGVNIRPEEEYESLESCIETLKRYVKDGILPERNSR